MNEFQKLLLQRCNELALRARGRTGTNPNVGAIVFEQENEKIMGEGWHQKFGESHAEVHAIANAQISKSLKGKGIAVSLEPCNHKGKTPACTTAIINQNFGKVLIDQIDPNPRMSGSSISFLKDNKIDVDVPLQSSKGAEVLRPFWIGQQFNRPLIVIKMAISKDGFIGQPGKQIKISNSMSDRWVHRMRNEHEAIMVGTKTAINDNPALTSRYNNVHQPIRIIPDRRGILSNKLRIFNKPGRTIVFTESNRKDYPAEVLSLKPFEISKLFARVYEKKIGSILVEGGSTIVQSLIDQQLWDSLILIQSETVHLGSGVPAPFFPYRSPNQQIKLGCDSIIFINNPKSR